MVVYLVLPGGGTGLVEALELIEAYRVAVRHEQAVESHGQAASTERVNLLGVTEHFAPGWNEKALAVVRIDIVGDKAVHGSRETASGRRQRKRRAPFLRASKTLQAARVMALISRSTPRS
jgi:hypothetical protein